MTIKATYEKIILMLNRREFITAIAAAGILPKPTRAETVTQNHNPKINEVLTTKHIEVENKTPLDPEQPNAAQEKVIALNLKQLLESTQGFTGTIEIFSISTDANRQVQQIFLNIADIALTMQQFRYVEDEGLPILNIPINQTSKKHPFSINDGKGTVIIKVTKPEKESLILVNGKPDLQMSPAEIAGFTIRDGTITETTQIDINELNDALNSPPKPNLSYT